MGAPYPLIATQLAKIGLRLTAGIGTSSSDNAATWIWTPILASHGPA
jgi:hypothetical protein